MIQCIGCKSFSFKRVTPRDAKQGKGHCEHRAPFIRHMATQERDCEQFRAEETGIVQGRVVWLRNNEEKVQ